MASPPRASMPVHDPRMLRAIAHPVRNRILGQLTATGPSRAADLAQDLGIPANQASFHLRQLAKYGLVEEAPEAARDRRDRVWKLVDSGKYTINPRELEANPATRAAAAVWRRTFEAWAHAVISAALHNYRTGDGALRKITDDSLSLTRAEAQALTDELDEVIASWSERTRGRDPERRTYLLMTVVQPYPELDSHHNDT